MSIAGYPGTPLIKKLGIKPAMKILLMLETNITDQLCRKTETPGFIHLFVKNNKGFETEMKKLKPFVRKPQLLPFGYPGIKKLQRSQHILQKIRSVIMHCETD